jgi:hypothetical protein
MRAGQIDAAIIQPASETALVWLSKACLAVNMDSETIEVNVLAVNQSAHHPAQGSQMMDILPWRLELTHELM